MVFISPNPSATLPYPKAFTCGQAIASYPLTGSAITNPNHHSRSQMRTQHRPQRPYVGANIYPPWPPGMSFRKYQLQVGRWIAKYWKDELTSAQHTAWETFQAAAMASPNPPLGWKNTSYSKRGWPMFWLFNKVSASVVQYTYVNVDPTLPVPYPNPPANWDPPTITLIKLTYIQAAGDIAYVIGYPGYMHLRATNYVTLPGKLASPLHPASLIQLPMTYPYMPSDGAIGTPQTIGCPFSEFFPDALAGQNIAWAVRFINPNDGCPSNLTPTHAINTTLT